MSMSKAVIEIWLAARSDVALGAELAPLIEQLSALNRLGVASRTNAARR